MRRPRGIVFVALSAALTAAFIAGTSACSLIFESTLPGAAIADAQQDTLFVPGDDGGPLTPPPPPADSSPPPPPFCQSQTNPFLYCYDFDGDSIPLDTLGGLRLSQGARLEVANVVALSPPRSILASTTGGDAGDAFAALDHALNLTPDGVTYSFSLLVSRWQATSARLAGLSLAVGPSPCVVRLTGDGTTWSVGQTCGGADDTNDVSTAPIARGTWHRFSLAVAFNPMRVVTLDVDGVRALTVAPIASIAVAPVTIGLGLDGVTGGNVTLFQDDVLVTSP